MIIYFSGTGNSLATARKIAEATGDKVMELGGKQVEKSWQYHHPDVKLKDMIK